MRTRIQGIPCEVAVTYYRPPEPDLPEPEYEYRVCDTRGRYAGWLEAKMTRADHHQILDELEAERRATVSENRALARASMRGIDL